MRIDAHQHFWSYHPTTHDWIDDSMQVIRKDFFTEQLYPLLQAANMDGCVAVQADQTEQETEFLLNLASKNNWIKGVVGWVDLKSEKLEEKLQEYQQFHALKGFRHVLQGEDPSFMLSDQFVRGVGLLEKYGFTYDILIFPKHLNAALTLVKKFPNQRFVVDHIAKPNIKDALLDGWQQGIRSLAECPNVFCKISGMVTEANWEKWNQTDFVPYLDTVVTAFGMKRLMFGSDWPVCLVAAEYTEMLSIVQTYFSQFSKEEQTGFFGQNAIDFYRL
jgi:L-fuconolactonase